MTRHKIITVLVFSMILMSCDQPSNTANTVVSNSGVSKPAVSSAEMAKLEKSQAPTQTIEETELSSGVTLQKTVATCASCHGENGLAANADWPNLAGQNVEYLVQELKAFRDGMRVNPLMSANLVVNLSDQDLKLIATYYSNLPIAVASDSNKADVFELPGAHVRARCVSCHGMSGNSVTSLWPNIAGQNAGYISIQLRNYQSGARIHPIMQVISSELNNQQITDVADYYSRAK